MKSVALALIVSALFVVFWLGVFIPMPQWLVAINFVTGVVGIFAPRVYYDALIFTYRAVKLNVLGRI